MAAKASARETLKKTLFRFGNVSPKRRRITIATIQGCLATQDTYTADDLLECIGRLSDANLQHFCADLPATA